MFYHKDYAKAWEVGIFIFDLSVILRLMLFVFAPFVAVSAVMALIAYLIWRYSIDYWRRVFRTQARDLDGLMVLLTMKYRLRRAFNRNWGIQQYWQQTVKRHSAKEAIYDIGLEKSFSFEEVDKLSNQYANLLLDYGVKKDDVVGIFYGGGVHFVAAWLGCCKIGAVSSWMNVNLRRQPLAHLLQTPNMRYVLCSKYLQEGLHEVFLEGLLSYEPYTVLCLGQTEYQNSFDITKPLTASSEDPPVVEEQPNFKSNLCYIYTSGTTGLPKAAVIKHFRFFYMATGGEIAFGVKPKTDRLYIALPLYHTSAGILGIGQMVVHGASCVIRPKFSVSNFWSDCVKHNCTASQYIGELLRYLLLAPQTPHEKTHKVRLLIGNGLRPAIWKQFQERFHIKRIAEFYGSTEGTTNLVNLDGTEGSCGFMTICSIFNPLYPIKLFQVDEYTGELVKDSEGYCIPIKPGQTGALVCTMKRDNPLLHFEGYLDKEETSKKIIDRPLRGSCDPVFYSGDLLYWDKLGYFYFKDRIGDTYRWKGENVSTTEVESILQPIEQILESTVYGVELPGCEGRCGMAAIVPIDGVSVELLLKRIATELKCCLPPYAVPLFIRVLQNIDKTSTFKMKKVELQKLGIESDSCSGVYYLSSSVHTYNFLRNPLNDLLKNGELKL